MRTESCSQTREAFSQFFWERVDIAGPDDCWPWTKTTVHGYGQVKIRGRRYYAHRVAWELENGPIPEGLTIDHTCHNGTGCPPGDGCPHRRCCNPSHLDAVPQGENYRRSHNAPKYRTHCAPGGHPLSGANLYINPRTGSRSCVICRRDAGRRYDEKRRGARR